LPSIVPEPNAADDTYRGYVKWEFTSAQLRAGVLRGDASRIESTKRDGIGSARRALCHDQAHSNLRFCAQARRGKARRKWRARLCIARSTSPGPIATTLRQFSNGNSSAHTSASTCAGGEAILVISRMNWRRARGGTTLANVEKRLLRCLRGIDQFDRQCAHSAIANLRSAKSSACALAKFRVEVSCPCAFPIAGNAEGFDGFYTASYARKRLQLRAPRRAF
jgi:hypothetical protein